MVGRPGRSKGCLTCRKRHVRCDEAKPRCKRCERASYFCAGYPEINFVDECLRFQKPTSKSLPGPPATSSDGKEEETELSVRGDGEPTFKNALSPAPLRTGARLSCLQMDVFISYTIMNLFKGPSSRDGRYNDYDTTSRWIPASIMDKLTPLSETCLQSIAAAFFGRVHGRPDITREGSERYSVALRKLQKQLNHPVMCLSTETLTAVNLLGIYEFLCFTSEYGWVSHALGLARLVELRGAEAHASSQELPLFENMRFFMMIASIYLHEGTFLAKPEWKTTPWSLRPTEKNPLQHLLDVLVDVPGLLEDRDVAMLARARRSPTADADIESVGRKMLQIMRDLHEWRQNWEVQNPGAAYEVPSPEPLFPTVFHFTSLESSNQIALYNAALVLLCQSASLLQLHPTAMELDVGLPLKSEPSACMNPLNPTSFPIDDVLETGRAAAIEICRCVHFYFLDVHAGTGSFFLVAPVRIAWQTLGGHSTREGRWLDTVLAYIGTRERGGWAAAKHLVVEEQVTRRLIMR